MTRPKPQCVPEGNARENAYRYITGKIIDMSYPPGTALSDKSIAEALQMSRTPVREALILLKFHNMVITKPQSGTFVAPISLERTAIEQFRRFALEKEIISRACLNVSGETAARYEKNLQRTDALQNGGTDTDAEFLKLDNEFHSIAFSAVQMDALYREMVDNMHHIERFRILSLRIGSRERVCREHHEIASAITGGRQTAALYHIEQHLGRYRQDIDEIREKYPDYFSIR